MSSVWLASLNMTFLRFVRVWTRIRTAFLLNLVPFHSVCTTGLHTTQQNMGITKTYPWISTFPTKINPAYFHFLTNYLKEPSYTPPLVYPPNRHRGRFPFLATGTNAARNMGARVLPWESTLDSFGHIPRQLSVESPNYSRQGLYHFSFLPAINTSPTSPYPPQYWFSVCLLRTNRATLCVLMDPSGVSPWSWLPCTP